METKNLLLLQLWQTLKLLYWRVLTDITINSKAYFQRRHLKCVVAKPKNIAVSILLFGNRRTVPDVFAKEGWFQRMEKVTPSWSRSVDNKVLCWLVSFCSRFLKRIIWKKDYFPKCESYGPTTSIFALFNFILLIAFLVFHFPRNSYLM